MKYNITKDVGIRSSTRGRGGEGVLPKMAYTERLHQKGVPFSGLRYTEGYGFYSLKNSKG